MSFIKFKYNSYHKIITVLIIIVWAIIHFNENFNDQKYYDNGQIKRKGITRNARNEGKWIWYYENGQKEMEGSFVNGKREGKWVNWDEVGNLLNENTYKNDKLNGESLIWNHEGTLISRQEWKDDKLISSLTN